MAYTIKKAVGKVDLSADWNSDIWQSANEVKLEVVMKPEEPHQPPTRLKMLYDDNAIYGLYEVQDQYVKAVAQKDQEQVCLDSCVEFFVRPANWKNYFNFEMNCGGTLLLYDVKDCRSGDFTPVVQEELDTVIRFHTLPKQITEEITEPVTWRLGFEIPLKLFAAHGEITLPLTGQVWNANFTKCADECSHPQWLSWMPLPVLDFHLPECFGEIIFE